MNVDNLVLGAFGCGAFYNNPEIVAEAFFDAINIFPKIFEKIEFAIYCTKDLNNLNAFNKVSQRKQIIL